MRVASAGSGPERSQLITEIAVLMLTSDLVGVWCNDRYRDMVIDRESVRGGVKGRRLSDFSPVIGPAKEAVYRRVAETGISESGTDYLVDLGGKPRLFHWIIHRPSEDLLLTLIDCVRVAEPDSDA